MKRLTLLLLPALLHAQDYRARLQGFVFDSSQAAVAGAKLTLRNQNTGIEAARDSSTTGQYLFDSVEPGTYTVAAEFPGFTRAVQTNVLVQTRADVTVNFTLTPGQLTESVTVTADPVALQFNTSTRELTVDRKMLMELPVKARNPFTLALLDPAVVNRYGAERNPFFMWSSSSIDVGGSTNRKNDLLLDGAPLQLGQKGSYAPPMDAVQEFSIQQNSVDAEFGHSAGGVLSVSIRSGTNNIHGTAYYFGRNPYFNAVTNSVTRAGNFIRNHIGGGTIGGPIRKNKLFTFTSYEQWSTKEPRNTIRTMPTALERAGDFSQSKTIFGGLRAIYDPWTSVLNTSNNTGSRQPFAGNVIPRSRIDPTAARIMQDLWEPNGPGDNITGVNNFKTAYSWFINNWNFNNRTDWNINDKWKVFARYSRLKTTLDQLNYTPNQSAAMPNDNGGIMNSRNIAGDAVFNSGPRTVFNFRGSFSSLEDDYNAPKAAVGESGLATFWPNNPWYKPYSQGMPAIYYPNMTIGGVNYGKSSYWIQHPRSYNFSGKMSHALGKHYIKAGGETRSLRSDGQFPDLMTFVFNAGLTADTFIATDTRRSGDAHATFLLGALDSGSQARYIAPQNIAINYYGAFLHDDFKISRRLTLNLGVRYEYSSAPVDSEDRFSRYVDLNSPIPEMQATPPRMPAELQPLLKKPQIFNGAWVFTDDQNRGLYNTRRLTLLPRIGAAFRLNDKTALNAGFARYVVPAELHTVTIERINFPGFSATSTTMPLVEGRPQSVLSDPFRQGRNPLQPIVGKGFGRYTNLGNGVSWDNQDFRGTTNDRINFTIQRQLWAGFKFDGTYFLNFGRHLPYTKNFNLVDPRLSYEYKTWLSQNVPNPFFNYLTPDKFPGQQRNLATVSRASLLRPYPQYGAISALNTPGLQNRYRALQLRAQRAYSNGASLLVSYNFNRERNQFFFNSDDEFDQKFSWLDSNNPRHRLTAAGSYDLPIGRNRRFFSSMHPVANHAFGGWQISSILSYSSGAFLRFGGLDVSGDPVIDNPTPTRWFNTSVFRIQTPFTPRTNPYQYEGLTGPFSWNLDTTISKAFQLTERFKLEFKLEAYNATNSFIWNDPNTGVTSTLFGRSTNQANRGREVQYTLRLQF